MARMFGDSCGLEASRELSASGFCSSSFKQRKGPHLEWAFSFSDCGERSHDRRLECHRCPSSEIYPCPLESSSRPSSLAALSWSSSVGSARPITISDLQPLLYLAIGTQVAALLPIRWRTGVQSCTRSAPHRTGLVVPGAGPGLVGVARNLRRRVPGRGTTWWILLFNRGCSQRRTFCPRWSRQSWRHPTH